MEKVKQTYKLPEGWIWTNISELFVVIGGGTPTKNNSRYWGGDINWASVKDVKTQFISSTIDKITKEGFENSNTKIAESGDVVLVTRISPGQVSIVKSDTAINQDLKILKIFGGINPSFVYYLLASQNQQFITNASGTTVKGIKISDLENIIFPLPPLDEQSRIVAKIELLISELEQAEKGLQNAKQQLETYRQVLLKKAFNGELSKKWRDENLEERNNSDNESPISWSYQTINILTDFVGSGSTPKGGKNIYTEDGIPFIRSQNVLVNRLIEDDLVFISSEIHEKMKRTHTKPKDVLLNITGASIGRCAYIPEGLIDGNVNQHVCIIRVNNEIIHYKYLTFFLNSPKAQLKIKQINTGATREALTLSQIKDFKIPVCDIQEQFIITQILESQFTLIDNLTDTINNSFIEIESFRYSILKKAFNGKLVEQESTDEPVQKLLDLIKKEKTEYLIKQKEAFLNKPKRIHNMETNKTVWQILRDNKTAMRSDKLWSESKHKDDIDAFYAEIKELINSGKIIEEKRQGKVSYLKVK
jgi:type I restriction enzyme S subunit